MRTLRVASVLPLLAAASLLAGCYSAGVRPRDRDRDRDRDRGFDADREHEEEDARPREVRGVVQGVDPVNHRIDIAEGEGPRRGERGGDIDIYYDSMTRLGNSGRHLRPQDLRRGDQIRAEVQPSAAGLIVQEIEVLSEGRGEREPEGPQGMPPPDLRGERPEDPDMRERREERRDAPDLRDTPDLRDDSRPEEALRGVVRYVDLSASTVEIETGRSEGGRAHRVRVQYDAETAVEFQGKPFSPENLQLGDRVEVALRGHGGPPFARRIVILSGEGTESH